MFYRHKNFVKWTNSNDRYGPHILPYLQYIKRVSVQDMHSLQKLRINLGKMLEAIYRFQGGYDNIIYGKVRNVHDEIGNIIDRMEEAMNRYREEREEHVRSRWEYDNGY